MRRVRILLKVVVLLSCTSVLISIRSDRSENGGNTTERDLIDFLFSCRGQIRSVVATIFISQWGSSIGNWVWKTIFYRPELELGGMNFKQCHLVRKYGRCIVPSAQVPTKNCLSGLYLLTSATEDGPATPYFRYKFRAYIAVQVLWPQPKLFNRPSSLLKTANSRACGRKHLDVIIVMQIWLYEEVNA